MEITNTTIQKLTTQELNDLDCLSTLDLGLYKGELKNKVKVAGKFITRTHRENLKAEVFELDTWEAHFIQLADIDQIPHWAFRMWDKEKEQYIKPWNLLMALTFIK